MENQSISRCLLRSHEYLIQPNHILYSLITTQQSVFTVYTMYTIVHYVHFTVHYVHYRTLCTLYRTLIVHYRVRNSDFRLIGHSISLRLCQWWRKGRNFAFRVPLLCRKSPFWEDIFYKWTWSSKWGTKLDICTFVKELSKNLDNHLFWLNWAFSSLR